VARTSFVMLDLVELFTHWHWGRSQVQLAESLGIDRKRSESIWPRRSRRHRTRRRAAVRYVARWFPHLTDPGARASTWHLIAPYVDLVKQWLVADATVANIAQRLREEHAVVASESSVRRWIAAHFAE
jgi:hypothetical protein